MSITTTARKFDTIVIGAGSGGLTAAIGLALLGKKVGLVERGPVGGDCTNVTLGFVGTLSIFDSHYIVQPAITLEE